jgi:hypothetical protein
MDPFACLSRPQWHIVLMRERIREWDKRAIHDAYCTEEIGDWNGIEFAVPMFDFCVYAYALKPVQRLLFLWDKGIPENVTTLDGGYSHTIYTKVDDTEGFTTSISKDANGGICAVMFCAGTSNVALVMPRALLPAYEDVAPVLKVQEEAKAHAGASQETVVRASEPEGRGDWGPPRQIVVDAMLSPQLFMLGSLYRYFVCPSVRLGKWKTDTTRGACTYDEYGFGNIIPDPQSVTVYDEGKPAYQFWVNIQNRLLPVTSAHKDHTKGYMCFPVDRSISTAEAAYECVLKNFRQTGFENVATKKFELEHDGVIDNKCVMCAEDSNNQRLFMWITGIDAKQEGRPLAMPGMLLLAIHRLRNTDMNTRT